MSTREKYLNVLANMSRFSPTDLDALLDHGETPTPPNKTRKLAPVPPSSVLWAQDRDEDVSHIGIRIRAPIENPASLVGKLASLALEKRVVPIFISWMGNCGLQHHGLHVEQISGASEAECSEYEEQLKRMWNLAIIIDAEDVLRALT